jgi:hypothetical protein
VGLGVISWPGRAADLGGAMSAGSGEPVSAGLQGALSAGLGAALAATHVDGLSGGGFRNAPLAINTGRFTSPSALVGQHTAAAGARLNMRYRRYHGRRYYANHCFIAANDSYSCQPYGYCACSTLP